MEPTICVKCKHFLNPRGTNQWLDQLCKAHPLARVFDYVTGKQEPQEYAACRDVNDGQCAKFEAKTP